MAAQNDMIIGNQAFPAFRADLNTALQALASLSWGPTEPTTKYVYQLWADTTTGFLKMRNAANSAWIILWELSKQGLIAQDCGSIYAADAEASDAYVISMTPTVTALTVGQLLIFKANTSNTGACSLAVDATGVIALKKKYNSDLETGDILAGQDCVIVYDGTNYQLLNPSLTLDEKIKVSSNDTTAGYLDAKLLAGSNITLTVGNEGVNETLTISGNTSTTRSGVSVTMDADEDFAANVTEDIPFDVEALDVANEFNTTTNTFTAANEGIYSVFLHLVFSSLTRTHGNSRIFIVTTGIGSISEYLSLNGTGIYKADVPITYDFHALMSLAATETIKAQIRGGSADSGTIESSMSYMTIVRVN